MLRPAALALLLLAALAVPAGAAPVRPAISAFDEVGPLPKPVRALAKRATAKATATGTADVRARGARVRIQSAEATCPPRVSVTRTVTFKGGKVVQRFAGSRTATGEATGTIERRAGGRTVRAGAPAALLATVPACPAPTPAPVPAPPAPSEPAPAPSPAPLPSPEPTPSPAPAPDKPATDGRPSYYVEFSYSRKRVGMREQRMTIEGTVHPVPGKLNEWRGEGWLTVSEPRDRCPSQWYPDNDPMAEKVLYEPALVTGLLDPYGKGMWFGGGSSRWVPQIGPVTTPGEEYVYIDDPASGETGCGALISHTQSGWFSPS